MDSLNDDPNHNFSVDRSSIVKKLYSVNRPCYTCDNSNSRGYADKQLHSDAGHFNPDLYHIFAVRPSQWIKCIYYSVLFFLFCFWPPATASAAQITLAWDAVEDADLADYRVYSRISGGNYSNNPIWTGESTSCTIENLAENSSYCFVVRSSNLNHIESDDSNEVCHSTGTDNSNGNSTEDEIDTDEDGMPDAWEIEMGLDPNNDDSQQDPDGDAISNIDEYENRSDPWEQAENIPPSPPSGKWPVEGGVVDTMVPEFETDEFVDTDTNDKHQRTRWRIVREFDDVCVFDGRSKFFLTKFIVPNWVLEPETKYYWQVQFFDEQGAASEWSSENRFETSFDMTDRNGDGIPDEQEVDQSQDINEDGILDAMQPDTIKLAAGSDTNGVVGVGIIEDQENQIISGMSSGESQTYSRMFSEQTVVPFGVFQYKVEVTEPGSAVQVKVFLPSAAGDNLTWCQLGMDGDWVDDGQHALFSPDRKSITLELKDGGYGDIDGIENGIIIDRSGLTVSTQSSGDDVLPASMEWGGSGGCFVSSADKAAEVKRFYLWLAVAGIAMILLSKIAAIWHERSAKTKNAR